MKKGPFWSARRIGSQPAEGTRERTCGTRVAGLRRSQAAARCARSGANSEFKIQDSKLQIGLQPAEDATTQRSCGPPPPGGCGPPIAARLLPCKKARSRADGPATIRSSPPPGGGCGLLRPCGRKFIIQDSEFKITDRAAACGGLARADLRTRAAGLRPPEAAARCGSGRNRKFMIQNSIFKIR